MMRLLIKQNYKVTAMWGWDLPDKIFEKPKHSTFGYDPSGYDQKRIFPKIGLCQFLANTIM